VEVHGGATNEEVIVPVIEITLANAKTEVKLVESVITANFKTPAELVLFSTTELNDISLEVKNKRYAAAKIDQNRWRVIMPDIKRAGNYSAEVFENDDLIGTVMFTVKGGAAAEKELL